MSDRFIVGKTISLVCKVESVLETKDVTKNDGKQIRMTKFMVNEGFNKIPLCIFGWFGSTIKIGDYLDLQNVFISEYNNVTYLTLGKHGSCNVLGEQDFKNASDIKC